MHLSASLPLFPLLCMLLAMGAASLPRLRLAYLWRAVLGLSGAATVAAGVACITPATLPAILMTTPLGLAMALLVQLLGTVIAAFSARYLAGEARQQRYVSALAQVLAAVQVLLLANHWVVLIGAWALVGTALQQLLCFYADRPFALLAAHKKRIADRLADLLLVAAAALAWDTCGSGYLSALFEHIASRGMSGPLYASGVALVVAVILRTALLPVHGWLIQVMEAPTPVSALLHAGVVNLGGVVLIRFAPLLEQADTARSLLVVLGLLTAVLAGMVMLTRISIKVRLAWSTVAQMGFLLLECGLGLYSLAALHLIGHSLYKAHAFLSASSAVRRTRLQALHTPAPPAAASLWLAPVLALALVELLHSASGLAAWPWWWRVMLALAWAPLLWLPANAGRWRQRGVQLAAGMAMVGGLSLCALAAHLLPLGTEDSAHPALGLIALLGMAALYAALMLLQLRPQSLSSWRRWSYAGFYIDEAFTRLALRCWPTRWTPATPRQPRFRLLHPLNEENAWRPQ
ncbi:NADH-quinone oxidoreductase subunit L [Massilia sp. TS11]|uniref:NADH-quinone oxidoreductase subunit L n=1 Tax=Massilia sp. TS11 TaxID=2908003 RepID=UPI001EDAAA90|nr:NADH-quinone oxidoreductase subunit L [Massilia sp. TS11]MCG2584757.1 NADH-quinone oxidoreductase subunit L [Massilia sp. TS11]